MAVDKQELEAFVAVRFDSFLAIKRPSISRIAIVCWLGNRKNCYDGKLHSFVRSSASVSDKKSVVKLLQSTPSYNSDAAIWE